MNTRLLKMARKHFTKRHDLERWIRSVRMLGSKWVLSPYRELPK
jgi:hypothetical protein